MLLEAIIMACDRASADVALRSDLCVAQIRQMHGFGALADGAFLEFDKIADARTGFEVIVLPQSRERADDHAVIQAALRHDAMRVDGDLVAEDGIGQDASRLYGAARSDSGFAQQLHAWFDDRAFTRDRKSVV